MFCEKCGNEIKVGAKFCEECGAAIETKKDPCPNNINATQKPKSVGRRIVILSIIAATVIILVVVIVLVKRIEKDDVASEAVNLDTSTETETMSDDLTGELPEIAPDSEEEYEALFDKLEYLTLGDEAETDGATVEDNLTAEDMSTDESDEAENGGDIIASALSTTDYAKAMDFEWLHDVMESDGTGAGRILDASLVNPIPADDNSYLNGGWKAYMYGTDPDYGERYLNAEIDVRDEQISITLNWKYFSLDGTSYEESGSSVFNGQRSSENGVLTAQSSNGNLELSEFYISKDEEHEYALGAFQYPSGELFILGLMR